MSETGPDEGRRRPVRRRPNAQHGRQHAHQVKVTPEEEARLLMKANRQGKTVARLLAESALADEGSVSTDELHALVVELAGLHRVIGGIARNVNQIAKATNATGEVQEAMAAAFVASRRTCARIDAVMDAVGAVVRR